MAFASNFLPEIYISCSPSRLPHSHSPETKRKARRSSLELEQWSHCPPKTSKSTMQLLLMGTRKRSTGVVPGLDELAVAPRFRRGFVGICWFCSRNPARIGQGSCRSCSFSWASSALALPLPASTGGNSGMKLKDNGTCCDGKQKGRATEMKINTPMVQINYKWDWSMQVVDVRNGNALFMHGREFPAHAMFVFFS